MPYHTRMRSEGPPGRYTFVLSPKKNCRCPRIYVWSYINDLILSYRGHKDVPSSGTQGSSVCVQRSKFISLWEGPSPQCWSETSNYGKKRGLIWREIRIHHEFDGSLSAFKTAVPTPVWFGKVSPVSVPLNLTCVAFCVVEAKVTQARISGTGYHSRWQYPLHTMVVEHGCD